MSPESRLLDVSSLSGWFALESYPTDTAAFMGIRDMAGTSVAVCVDRYGELLLGMGQNGSYSYCSLKTKVDRFKWLHVVLDLSNESVCLNGQRMSAFFDNCLDFSIAYSQT